MQDVLCPACGRSNSEFDTHCSACGTPLFATGEATVPDAAPLRASSPAGEDGLLGRQISHFRIQRLIGRGGMGVVYQALDLELGRVVALKFLSRGERSPRDEARFRREAQATAALDHPNIGTIYEVGEHEGRRFIAMAYYDGETLATRLDREGALSIADTAAIAGQLASALAAAHGAGIIHRDLKPDNVMLTRDRRVKLLDFGLAKWAEVASVTEKGMVIGTAAYMAPEQLRGESSAAADLWAFGVVLYQMLAGERPFGGERKGMVHGIFHEDPPPLHGLRPDVPEALERIVTRCLAKEPGGRYPDAAAILAELAASGLWESVSSGSALVPAPRRNRRLWPWLAAALVLLAAGAAAFFLLRKPEPPVYVAVLKPEVSGSLLADDNAQVKLNLQSALLRTVAALDGLAALDTSHVNAVKGTPVQIARAVAAGEVVASQADCAGDLCQVSLRRLAGNDGRILWTEALQLPLSKPRLFAEAVAVALRQGYAGRDLRVPHIELETSEEDYRAYLDMRRKAADPAAYQEVLDRLETLRSKAPGFLETYSLEANVARRLYDLKGDARYLERGIDVARRARERAPGDPRPLANLFDLYLDAGNYPEADAVLAQLAEVDPAGSLLRRGQLAERQGRSQEALELLAEAVRLQPSWRSLLILANAEYRQGRLDDARRHLAELLQRSPGNLEGLKALAQIELLNDPDRALILLRQIAASTPNAESLINLGVALLLRRQYGEAEESFRKALELQPGTPSATLNLADCLLLQGHGAEARVLYAEIVAEAERANRGNWEHLATKAQALAHLGEPTRSVEAIQHALRLTPDNAQLSYEAAVVYTLVGDQSSALVHAQRAAAGGVSAYWFALPFFDPLRSKPAFQALSSPTRG